MLVRVVEMFLVQLPGVIAFGALEAVHVNAAKKKQNDNVVFRKQNVRLRRPVRRTHKINTHQ